MVALVLLLVSVPRVANAQFYNGSNMSFGKNRVQWDNFYWQYLETEKFDVYYYQNGEELASYVVKYVTDIHHYMERRVGTRFGKKIQFVVFNSMSDFKQSNIGIEDEDNYNSGGSQKVMNYKVMLWFDGNYVDFERQIREGMIRLLLYKTMSGNSIGSQLFGSSYDDIPEWFSEGLVSYIIGDWTTLMDNRLQNGIQSGRYRNIGRLQGEDARVAGHAFWIFIEETYGRKVYVQIIRNIRSTGSVSKSLRNYTGVKWRNLSKAWLAFCTERFGTSIDNVPDQLVELKYKRNVAIGQPRVSPDGSRMAYTTNDGGQIRIWLKNTNGKKRKLLYKGGFHSDSDIDSSYPLLSWNPYSNILAAVVEEKGKILLYLFDIEEDFVEKRFLFDFQKVTSIAYSSNGRKLVMAATRKGMPDIFVYDLTSNRSEQITNDFYTDCNPVFVDGDKRIVFTSNRTSDTLLHTPNPVAQKNVFNLYAYDMEKGNMVLQNLTCQQVSNSLMPVAVGDDRVCFLNDSSGFFNVYEAAFDSAISFIDTAVHYSRFAVVRPLTSFEGSITDYTYNPSKNNFVVLMDNGEGGRLYTIDGPQAVGSGEVKLSPAASRRFEGLTSKHKPDEGERRRLVVATRPVDKEGDSLTHNLLAVARGDKNILQYRKLHNLNPNDTAAPEQRVYYTEFFYDKMTTQVDFTYINYNYQPFAGGGAPIFLNSGYNIYFGTMLKDLMENKKVNAGVKINSTLLNNEYAISFSDLTHRLDRTVTLHRVVVDNSPDDYTYTRTFSNEVYYQLSFPLSEILSLRGTAIYRHNNLVYLSTGDYSLLKDNTTDHWCGLRGELVYDNSRLLSTNLHVGARAKVFGEYYQTVSHESMNFFVVGLDYRKYTRISRNFIWANRLAASSSFGQGKLIYYMGGEDGWLMPKFNTKTAIDYSQNYVYQTLATNMRGFDQNVRNGNSFVVFNSEFRFPVFSYFNPTPIKSRLIRDLQLVAFGDVGTAWSGLNPYDKSNFLYTSYIEDGSLDISVTLQKEPVVGGFGFGLRTTVLGYFMRADVAWGIEDFKRNDKPVFCFSLSYDF